ncbi:MAG: hypothetical protein KGL39_16815 [Patescibacteria group bacterium]|nr:hypothetical protein [Patescibacteria group bacterium]
MHASLFGYAGHTAVKRALEAIFVDSLTQLLGGQENVLKALSAHDDAVSRGDAAAPEIFFWQEAVDQASDAAFSQLRRPDHAHFEVEE